MSVNLSNKLPASSHHSSVSSGSHDDLPTLIAVHNKQLPTFAEAATAVLPCTVITSEDLPPSFRLTIAPRS